MDFYHQNESEGGVQMLKILKIILKEPSSKIILALYPLIALLSGILLVYSNDMLRNVFNNHIMLLEFNNFLYSTLFVVGLFVSLFLLRVVNSYIKEKLHHTGANNLIEHYTNKLLKADYSYYHKKEAPAIWDKLERSTIGTGNFFGSLISSISTMISFVFYAIVIFRINLFAGLITMIAIPIYFFLTVGFNKNFMSLQMELANSMGQLAVVGQEPLENVVNVKTKNAYGFFVNRIMKIQRKISKLFRKFNVLSEYHNGITGLVSVVVPILVLFATLQVSDTFTTDMGTVLILYINIPLFLSGFTSIYKKYIMYKTHRHFINGLLEFDDMPIEHSGEIEINDFENLEVKGVKVRFDDTRIISIPDFVVKKGERVMIFGESGIGKSTIFNIICVSPPAYEGDIIINGINLRNISTYSLRNVFGIVLQSVNIFSMSLEDNILLGIPNDNLNESVSLANLKEQMDFKVDQELNNKVVSGGEKSRVGLAQTLARNTQVLMIDETFSSIDEGMEERIVKGLFEMHPHKTFICISHRSSSQTYFDKFVDFNL